MNQPLKLSQLTTAIARVMQENFGSRNYWVVAEVSGLKYYSGKNYYFFNLVEKEAGSALLKTSIATTAWSSAVNHIRKFERITGKQFADNLEVLCCVRVEYHITYGLKLNLIDIDPSFTLGKLALQREAVIEKLVNENPGIIRREGDRLLTFNQQLPRPSVIQRIALVGSPETDGYRDFKHELENNMYNYYFIVDEYATMVQGVSAEKMMVQQLENIEYAEQEYDAVVLVRGGGADTDFLAYDGYELNRIIAGLSTPVFTGIGHTRNETIADLTAYMSLKTPTKVAAFFIEFNLRYEEDVKACWSRIAILSLQHLGAANETISGLQMTIPARVSRFTHLKEMELNTLNQVVRNEASAFMINHTNELNFMNHKLVTASKGFYERQKHILEKYEQVVQLSGPERILKRGFAIVYQNGHWVRDPNQLKPESEIETVFYKTKVKSVVKNIIHGKEK